MFPKSAQLLGRFRRDRRGNIAVIFALSLLPVLSCIGCAVDYSRATQLRSKLQAAIDAASVGSIAKTSPAFIAAGDDHVDGKFLSRPSHRIKGSRIGCRLVEDLIDSDQRKKVVEFGDLHMSRDHDGFRKRHLDDSLVVKRP